MTASVTSAYMVGFIAFAVCMLISIFVANIITDTPDGSSIGKRKIAFWILAVILPIAIFFSNYFFFYTDIRVPSRADAYMNAMCISAGVFFVLYIVLGFALAKICNHGKLSSWF